MGYAGWDWRLVLLQLGDWIGVGEVGIGSMGVGSW